MRLQHMLHILKQRDELDGLGFEFADPLRQGHIPRQDWLILPLVNEITIKIINPVKLSCGGRHGEDHLKNGSNFLPIEQHCCVP